MSNLRARLKFGRIEADYSLFPCFLETVDGVDLEVDSMQMKRLRAGCEDTLLVDLH